MNNYLFAHVHHQHEQLRHIQAVKCINYNNAISVSLADQLAQPVTSRLQTIASHQYLGVDLVVFNAAPKIIVK